jgi:Fe-S cluster assembly protein SufD
MSSAPMAAYASAQPAPADGRTPALVPPKTRAQAVRSFDVADFPALTGREEEWRFTPLKRLRGLESATVETPIPGMGPKVEVDELPDGVTVSTVDRSDPRLVPILVPFDRISALASRAASETLLIRFAASAAIGVRLVGNGTELAFGHTYIDIDRLVEATLVIEQTGSVTLADNVEVNIGDGARLTLVTVTDWARDAVQAQHLRFRLGRDAKLTHVQVTLGGDLVRQYTSIEYAGRGGDCEAYGLYFAGNQQHFEHRLLVDHSVPDCRSNVAYRGALQGAGAHTVWVGDVLIRAEATGTDTYEVNRNLVLTDGARADSVPNLEIETGEVVGAGHASATGRFDDEQLFYLMARGIPAEEARKLVVRGFFNELLGKIPVEELRERLAGTIESRLNEVTA